MTAPGTPPATQPTTPDPNVLGQLADLADILIRLPKTDTVADYRTDLHAALTPYLEHGRQLLSKET